VLKRSLGVYISGVANKKEFLFQALNLLIPVLTGIYVFVTPLPVTSINLICFYLSCAILLTLLIFRKTDFTLRSPLTPPFLLFALWAVFGLLFALDLQNSLHDLRGHLLEYLIIYYLLINFYTSKKGLEILSLILITGATVFCIGACVSFYIIDGHAISERLGSSFKDMNTDYIGFITIFAMILAIRGMHLYKEGRWKALLFACALINVIITILTQSRGSLIGLGIAFIIMGFAHKKNFILLLMVCLLIMLIPGMKTRVHTEGFTKDVRIKMNRLTLEIVKDHPFAGIGFGMQTYGNSKVITLEKYNKRLTPEYQQNDIIITSPHNTILDIAVRTGVVGLIFFLSILAAAVGILVKVFLRNRENEYFKSWAVYLFAGLVSFMVPSFFADTTFGPRVIIFYVMLAMITILGSLSSQKQKIKSAHS